LDFISIFSYKTFSYGVNVPTTKVIFQVKGIDDATSDDDYVFYSVF